MRDPASREIISASVEPCETDVCFLHIQLFWARTYDFRICTRVLLMLILSLLNLWQHQSPETVPICNVVLCVSHMTILFEFTNVMNVWDQRSQALVACSSPLGDCTCKFVHGPLKYQAHQCAPNIGIKKKHIVSKPLTILQQSQFLCGRLVLGVTLKMSSFKTYWILAFFGPHSKRCPCFTPPEMFVNFGPTPLFQLLEALVLAEEEAQNVVLLPHPKFWPF